MADVTVNWKTDEVILAVNDARGEFLVALAHQVEAEAKPGMRVDTGFNRNSSYVVGAGQNTFQARQVSTTSKKTGAKVKRQTVNSPASPRSDDEVAIGFAADYAIYEELRNPTLYQALLRVAQQAGGTIEAIGRKHFG